jgi:4-hydroxybenzoate polyprenyltransferase
MKQSSGLIPLLVATRPHNSLGCAGVLAAGWLAGQQGPLTSALLPGLALGLLCAAAHLVNDVVDLPADRANRPARPLPRATLSVSQARRGAWVLLVLGFLLGMASRPSWSGWWLFWALGGTGYSLLAKGRPRRAPLWTALVIGSCWAAGAGADGLSRQDAVVGLAVVWFIYLREVVKGLEDARGDLMAGYGSCAGRFPGTRKGLLVLSVPLALAVFTVLLSGMNPLDLALGLVFLGSLALAVVFVLTGRPRGLPSAGSLLKMGAFTGLALLVGLT